MVEMDPTARYHRTLDSELNNEYAYVDAHYAGGGGATAYTLSDGTLRPIKYFKITGRDFKKYATAWEILHSKVPFGEGSGTVWPVVDELGVVVGHYGAFDSSEIFVPASLAGELVVEEIPVTGTLGLPRAVEVVKRPLSLKEYLEVGADVIADKYHEYYLQQGYTKWRIPQQSFTVITDLQGHVLLVLGSRDKEALTPLFTTSDIIKYASYALDLILVVELISLAAAGALAIRTYLRRRAVQALARGAEREVAAVAVRPRFVATSEGDIAVNPDVGLSRELHVAEMVGGRVAKVAKNDVKYDLLRGDPVRVKGKYYDTLRYPLKEGVKIDVLGPNGELIVVGGPAKAKELSDLGGNLKRLKELAAAHRVKALAYFEAGTPQSVIDVAIKWLGKENVHTF